MRIVSVGTLRRKSQDHPEAAASVSNWVRITKEADWQNFTDVRSTFATVSAVKNFAVFNIAGNRFRLITLIDYAKQKVFIRDFLTHEEYDKEGWKRHDPWFND